MTEREAQIFQWIKENPMITQQEIADRANITRSSVAVHISNLTKKGMLRGKGYILQEENYVTVVGAVNVDICGTPFQKLVTTDSNPGRMSISFGGVGRNIAENISSLGEAVKLITVLGGDIYASEIEKHCRSVGIDLTHTLRAGDANTSMYLCINDADGEMAVAVSDMELYDRLTPAYLATKLPIISGSEVVIIDANIPESSIQFLAENCTAPIFAEPVSTKKALKFRGVLNKLYLMKPNLMELGLLSGMDVTTEQEIYRAMDILLEKGIKHLIVSNGGSGVYYGSGGKKKHYPCLPCKMINTTGCGDALFGAVAWAVQRGETVENAINYGMAAAAICIEHDGAISRDMTQDMLAERLNMQHKTNK